MRNHGVMKKHVHLDPARTVIDRIGGPEVAAKATGRHPSRVRRWMYPREVGGTGGTIPPSCAARLLEYAQRHRLPLKPEHFFCRQRFGQVA